MSVTPEDFLGSAISLAACGLDEIHQRNGISRAYYASYHKACSVIAPDGKTRYRAARDGSLRSIGMHTNYLEQLNEASNGAIERQVGAKLGALYSGRITADYKLNDTVSPKTYAMQIARSQDIFNLINSNGVLNQSSTPPIASAQSNPAPAEAASIRPILKIVK